MSAKRTNCGIHIPFRPGADEEFDRQPLSILYDHLSQFNFLQRDNAAARVEVGQFDIVEVQGGEH